jgi:hypothetical protein
VRSARVRRRAARAARHARAARVIALSHADARRLASADARRSPATATAAELIRKLTDKVILSELRARERRAHQGARGRRRRDPLLLAKQDAANNSITELQASSTRCAQRCSSETIRRASAGLASDVRDADMQDARPLLSR